MLARAPKATVRRAVPTRAEAVSTSMVAQPLVLARAHRARLNMAQATRAARHARVLLEVAFALALFIEWSVRYPLRLAFLTALKLSVPRGTPHHSPVVARGTSI